MDKCTTFSFVLSLWISLCYAHSYQDFNTRSANSPLCGLGKCQSPIDLGPKSKIVHDLPIVFKNYSKKLSNATVSNTGHTVQITGNWGKSVPTITGAFINNARYLLNVVHFHWSENDNSGTEHTINGKRYACEVHLVHYNSKYGNADIASSKPDGLLVLGLLFKVNENTPNQGFQMMSHLTATVRKISSISTGIFDLGLFGIKSIKSFYTYAGSLTTPPFSENVRWVVSSEILSTNAAIMKVMRSTKLNHHDEANVRPIQSLNGREVILYKK